MGFWRFCVKEWECRHVKFPFLLRMKEWLNIEERQNWDYDKKKSNNIRYPKEHATCPTNASHEEESVTGSVQCPFFSSLRNTSFVLPYYSAPTTSNTNKTHITTNSKENKPISISWTKTRFFNMTTVEASNESMATVAEKAPVTAQRKVAEDLDTKLSKPCDPFSSYFAFCFN